MDIVMPYHRSNPRPAVFLIARIITTRLQTWDPGVQQDCVEKVVCCSCIWLILFISVLETATPKVDGTVFKKNR